MDKVKSFFIVILFFAFFVMLDNVEVSADYYDVCDEEVIQSENNEYKRCGNSNIYLLKDNKKYSSYLVANRDLVKNNQILYAGNINGFDTFYSLQFNYYSVVYDDRGLFTSSNNIWSDVSINNVVVYSGKFDDTVLFDESKRGFVNYFYNEVGTYLIRQYVGNEVVNAIKMIVVKNNEYSLKVNEVLFGDNPIDSEKLVYDNSDLIFNIGGGKYGFANKVDLTLNGCSIDVSFSKKIIVDNTKMADCIKKNDVNNISLTLYNGLNKHKTFKYKFRLHSSDLSISLEDSYSQLESTSRRIVIKASAGLNKNLNEDYCLYYWSSNSDDNLTYEDFMTNYEQSKYKGVYTDNKGVILRNSEGTYYLYALAKDEDSSLVVRSNEYVLKKSKRVNKVIVTDFIFVGVLCIGAAVPVFVYQIVRGKDTD